MEQLIGLVVAVVMVLFGVDALRKRETNRHLRQAEELDKREEREQIQRERTAVRAAELEERIRRREEEREKDMEMDSTESAVDRLRNEFGGGS